jgi:hypothetical protein
MGITVVKKKKVVEETTEVAKQVTLDVLKEEAKPLIDKLAKLEAAKKKAEDAAKKAKAMFEEEMEVLREMVKAYGMGPETTVELVGEGFECVVGAESTARNITDKEGLVKALEAVDETLPFSLAEFKLGDLDKYLSPVEQEKFITKDYTGKRTFKFRPA